MFGVQVLREQKLILIHYREGLMAIHSTVLTICPFTLVLRKTKINHSRGIVPIVYRGIELSECLNFSKDFALGLITSTMVTMVYPCLVGGCSYFLGEGAYRLVVFSLF